MQYLNESCADWHYRIGIQKEVIAPHTLSICGTLLLVCCCRRCRFSFMWRAYGFTQHRWSTCACLGTLNKLNEFNASCIASQVQGTLTHTQIPFTRRVNKKATTRTTATVITIAIKYQLKNLYTPYYYVNRHCIISRIKYERCRSSCTWFQSTVRDIENIPQEIR